MKKIFLPIFILTSVLFFSCQKGDDGPAGVQGLTGEPGSSNTRVKKILFSPNWADGSYMGLTVNKDTIPDGDINSTVIDQGGVFVFFKSPAGPEWESLPYSAGNDTSDIYIHVTTQPGQVNLYAWQKDSAGTITNFTPSVDSLKYIIVLDRSVTGRGTDLSRLSFDELCRYLHVKL